MKTEDFLGKLAHDRIVEAIAEAEKKTSGEIRVYVDRGNPTEAPLVAAERQFQKMGMEKTRDRNAVLIYVAPRPQKFAVCGDLAVDEKCGPDYWNELVAGMRDRLRSGDFTGALVEAITRCGELLALHFPRRADDQNELPDHPVEG